MRFGLGQIASTAVYALQDQSKTVQPIPAGTSALSPSSSFTLYSYSNPSGMKSLPLSPSFSTCQSQQPPSSSTLHPAQTQASSPADPSSNISATTATKICWPLIYSSLLESNAPPAKYTVLRVPATALPATTVWKSSTTTAPS
jgi:hypothetical protein